MVLAALGGALAGCASSPFDRDWVGREIERASGHAMGDPTQAPSLPPGLRDLGALDEEQAVAVALWNNPAFGAEIAQLGFSRADLADAGTLPNPTLSFLFPIGPRQLELSVVAPISALVQMPFRVKAAKLDVERVARGLVQRGLDVARDAKIAWAEVEAAKARALARKEMARGWQAVAKIARARAVAGEAPSVEADTAEAAAADALDQHERAQMDHFVATQRLRLLLGLGRAPLGEGIGTRSTPPDERDPADDKVLLDVALASRPDLRAAEISVEAAGGRAGWEKSRIFALLGRFDVKPIGTKGGAPLQPIPGFQVDLPIFNWNQGGIGRAEAELAQAALRHRALQEAVATDLRVARALLVQALASLRRFRETVLPLLERAAETALQGFTTGDQPYLVVLDVTRRREEARLRLIDLEAEVRRARASLDRHVGRRHDAR